MRLMHDASKEIMVLPFDKDKVNEWLRENVQVPDWEPLIMGIDAIEPESNWVIEHDGCYAQTPDYFVEGKLQEGYILEFWLQQPIENGHKQRRGGGILISCERLKTLCAPEITLEDFRWKTSNPRVLQNFKKVRADIAEFRLLKNNQDDE